MIRRFLALFKRGDGQDEELLFEDDFRRPAGPGGLSGWPNPEKTLVMDGHSLGLRNGWVASARSFHGNLRLEWRAKTLPGASVNFGAFMNGTEGFWSGYEIHFVGTKAYLRRASTLLAAADIPDLERGVDHDFFLQRIGSRVSAGLGDRVLVEAMDLDPLAQENHCRYGFLAFSTEARYSRVRLSRLVLTDKVSPLAAADQMFIRRRYQEALAHYRQMLPVLSERERELGLLKAALCLHRTGRDVEALRELEALRSGKTGEAAKRLYLRFGFEISISAGTWESHRGFLERISDDPGALAERQAAADSLGRAETVWRAKVLWKDDRARAELGGMTVQPDFWSTAFGVRSLCRFAAVTGQGAEIPQVLDMVLAARGETVRPGKDLGELYYQKAEALSHFMKRSDKAKAAWDRARRAFEIDDVSWQIDHALPSFCLEQLWGKDGDALKRDFLERLGRPDHGQLAYAFLRVAEYAWSRDDEAMAREMYGLILVKMAFHGTACCTALSALAAMDIRAGKQTEADSGLRRVLADYPAEVWAAPSAKFVLGRSKLEEYRHDPDREKIWTEGLRRATPFLAVAARLKATGNDAEARRELEMIRDVSLPWEPCHGVAESWLDIPSPIGRG